MRRTDASRSGRVMKKLGVLLVFGVLGALAGCDNGDSGNDSNIPPTDEPTPTPTPAPQAFTGAAVDGPIANAVVRLYRLDTSVENLQGELLDEGETDAQAKFAGLEVDSSETGPFLVVVTADEDTIDLNTQLPPIITEVRTIITVGRVGQPVYVTPLTSMAVALAVAKADDDGSVTAEELEAGLADAADEVVSALGFGMSNGDAIFSAPPVVTDDTDTDEELGEVAEYRTAIAGAAAIIFEIQQNSDGSSPDDVMNSLADDLSDGNIDGQNSQNQAVGDYNGDDAATIMETDPSRLTVPGTNKTVEQVEQLLDEEAADTGTSADTSRLADGTVGRTATPAEADIDRDHDGVINSRDAFPNDPAESVDTDGDGVGNNADPDDDNDGAVDSRDAFPLNPSEKLDSDGDGIGNNADDDDDNDGTPDSEDDFPLDPSATDASDLDNDGWPAGQDPDDSDVDNPGIPFVDTDMDGLGNSIDDDDDNDGVLDSEDDLPLDATESSDFDGDGIGDGKDDDIDGDGVPNHTNGNDAVNTPETRAENGDAFPFNSAESADLDRDGIGDNADSDADGDGLADVNDPDPTKKDTDGDGVRDGADALPTDPTEYLDSDHDGVGNKADNCKFVANANQLDTDQDGMGNACDSDDDNDTVLDTEDAFPLDPNASVATDADGDGWPLGQDTDDNDASVPQGDYVDSDGDGAADSGGLAPDDDDDNDGVNDSDDAFPTDPAEFKDSDQDGTGDIADGDDDNDGVADVDDAFPYDSERSADSDGDGFSDEMDNCPNKAGPQTDTDQDGLGNPCDSDDDNDGVPDNEDAFPLNDQESADRDGDGIGNNADTDDDGDGLSDTDEAELGTNPLKRDTDHDGVSDASDNCPLVVNPDQVDSDGDGTGNLCDDPPQVGGYYLLEITVNSSDVEASNEEWSGYAAEDCDDVVGGMSAEVAYVDQLGTNFTLLFAEDEFSGRDSGAPGTINALGQVVIESNEGGEHPDGRTEEFHVLFLGLRAASTGVISGSVEEDRVVTGADGLGYSCHSKWTVSMTPMPEVTPYDVFNAQGTDGGFFSSYSDEFWDDAGMHGMAFMYEMLNTDGDTEYRFDPDSGSWVADTGSDDGYVLTASGWDMRSSELLLEHDTQSVTAVETTLAGSVYNSWAVSTFAISAEGKPMDTLVDEGWVDEGLVDPTATFGSGVRAIAIAAQSSSAVYDIWCGDDDWANTGLVCANWLAVSWGMDGQPELATTLTDILHGTDQAIEGGWQGVWVGKGRDGELVAYLQGTDLSGAEGTSGTVTFFYDNYSGEPLAPYTDTAGNAVTGSWQITDPMNNDTHLVLGFTVPDRIMKDFEVDGGDQIIVAAVPDLSDGGSYLRQGRLREAGEIHRGAGLNAAGAAEALANFDYQPPSPEPSTEPTPEPSGEPTSEPTSEPTGVPTTEPSGEPTGEPTGVPTTEPSPTPVPTPVPTQEPKDTDGDGIADLDDNCVLVSNADQADTDQNGLGNACDLDVPQIFGVYLAELSYTPASLELDRDSDTCVAAEPGTFFLETHTEGNQVFIKVMDEPEDDGLGAIMNADGSFTLVGDADFSGSGTYFPENNGFSLTFNETQTSDMSGVSCASAGTVNANGPGAVVEQTAFSSGVTWFDSDSWDSDGDGIDDDGWYDYGTIMTGALEVQATWDFLLSDWTTLDPTAVDEEGFITSTGIETAQDLMTVDGFVTTTGETAIIKPTLDGTAVDFRIMHVDLEAFDITGVDLKALVPDFDAGFVGSPVFSSGAVAYVGHIQEQNDVYGFWCDDDYDDWFVNNLDCDNIVATSWQESVAGSGNYDPVPASSLDEIVNTTAELDTGAAGSLWIGENIDDMGSFSVQGFLVSDDGNASGSNLHIEYFNVHDGTAEPMMPLGSGEVTSTTVGGLPLISYRVPDEIARMVMLDMEESHRFVFEENVIETSGDSLVRMGWAREAGVAETAILFNATAKNDVLTNFSL